MPQGYEGTSQAVLIRDGIEQCSRYIHDISSRIRVLMSDRSAAQQQLYEFYEALHELIESEDAAGNQGKEKEGVCQQEQEQRQ